MSADRSTFERLQAEYRESYDKTKQLENAIIRRYGSTVWATMTQRKQLDRYRERQDKIISKMLALLDRISPRYWHEGVPVHWIMTELTYEDAVTSDKLSKRPPPAYGHTEADVDTFVAPIQSKRNIRW
jgi:hypothetical protein